jgi:hypothetical protein
MATPLEPNHPSPDAMDPDAVHPDAVHPDAVHPDAVHPDAVHPDAVHRDAVDADALAVPGGMRPVVWLADAAAPHALSPRLARALLDEHTRHGDVVVDIDDDVAFAAAAAETGRRHHALGGGHRLAPLGEAAGYVDLVLLRWPQSRAANPRWLLVACRTLLRQGSGVLAVAVSVAAADRIAHLSALTGAAHAVGLRQIRHVAVLSREPARPTSTSVHDPGSDDAAPPHADASGDTGGHVPAPDAATAPHTDLLIFAAEAGHHD